MNVHGVLKSAISMAALCVVCISAATGQPRAIDSSKSVMTVHVYKAGVFSALGHDHEIGAPVTSGTVDVQGKKVELKVDAAALKVQDAKVSDKDRAEIQSNMLGPEVLDTKTYNEIHFRSTNAESAGPGAWKLTGELTVRGQTKPVSMEVHERDGHYAGSCHFNISDFGIKPIKAAGGTVRVKDEVQVQFDIQLAR
jgi:polyisoprenoid-binding protein YceI